jgi:hypothetical protein
MTDDDKALVERLKRFSTRPIEHDAPAMNRVAMKEAADRIEAQAAEIERLTDLLRRVVNLAEAYATGTGEAFNNTMTEARAALEQSE